MKYKKTKWYDEAIIWINSTAAANIFIQSPTGATEPGLISMMQTAIWIRSATR